MGSMKRGWSLVVGMGGIVVVGEGVSPIYGMCNAKVLWSLCSVLVVVVVAISYCLGGYGGGGGGI
jgi:hypothetical protein